jgi:hypothetical protein
MLADDRRLSLPAIISNYQTENTHLLPELNEIMIELHISLVGGF